MSQYPIEECSPSMVGNHLGDCSDQVLLSLREGLVCEEQKRLLTISLVCIPRVLVGQHIRFWLKLSQCFHGSQLQYSANRARPLTAVTRRRLRFKPFS